MKSTIKVRELFPFFILKYKFSFGSCGRTFVFKDLSLIEISWLEFINKIMNARES